MIAMRNPLKRIAATCVDAGLRLLPAAPPARPLQSPRVLVIRCDHIGDAVMATSVLGPLRRTLAPSRLDVLAGPWGAEIFRAHPDVDEVLEYATPWWLRARGFGVGAWLRAWAALPGAIRTVRARKYDCVIDLRGDLRQIAFFVATSGASERVSSDRTGGRRLLTRASAYVPGRHEVDQDADVVATLGVAGPFEPALAASADAAPLPDALRHADYVVFALAGTEENRSWPAEHASAVAAHLWDAHGLRTAIVGGASDRARADAVARGTEAPVVSLCGETTIPQLLATLAGARAAVVVDSGPMHAAAALAVPTVALFGPGDPRECAPRGAHATVLGDAPCGCVHPRCEYTSGPGRCMRALSPASVIEAITPLLQAAR